MSTPEERIALRIKQARKTAGLSQPQAAQRVDVALKTWCRWETGQSGGFMGRLNDIAEALDTSTDALIAGDMLVPGPSVEALAAKMDQVLGELASLRSQLGLDGA